MNCRPSAGSLQAALAQQSKILEAASSPASPRRPRAGSTRALRSADACVQQKSRRSGAFGAAKTSERRRCLRRRPPRLDRRIASAAVLLHWRPAPLAVTRTNEQVVSSDSAQGPEAPRRPTVTQCIARRERHANQPRGCGTGWRGLPVPRRCLCCRSQARDSRSSFRPRSWRWGRVSFPQGP